MSQETTTCVRLARPGDVAQIVPLWRELMEFHRLRDPFFTPRPGGENEFAGFLTKNMADSKCCVLVAEQNGRIIGYTQGMIEKYPPVLQLAQYGHVMDLAVTEQRRRTGVGRRLVADLLRWFEAKGVVRTEVRMSVKNDISMRFWQSMGFRPYLQTSFRTIEVSQPRS